MTLEIKNTRDWVTPYLALLEYGSPKSGKTTLASTLGENPLVVDFDDGILALRDLGINYVQPRTWEEVRVLAQKIITGALREEIEYDSIVWDSHTFFYTNIVIPSITRTNQMTLADWGMANTRCKNLYSSLIAARNDQRYHFVLTAHEKIDKDENSGRIVGGINATPALRDMLPALFDEFFYVAVNSSTDGGKRSVKYQVHTVSTNLFPAGTRSRGRLLPVEVPNLTAIYQKIVGHPTEV